MKHLGDISKVHGWDIEPVDVIVGGSPCQDLSVAGLRKGIQHTDNGDEETTRSGLFLEQIRIIKEMRDYDRFFRGRTAELIRPRWAIWENVPGAFSSNKGEDFRLVIESFAKIADPKAAIPLPKDGKWQPAGVVVGNGWSLAYRVHDAQYWSVPQRRKRISLVVDFADERGAEQVLFERAGMPRNSEQSGKQGETASEYTKGSINGPSDSNARLKAPQTMQIRSGCDGGGKALLFKTIYRQH